MIKRTPYKLLYFLMHNSKLNLILTVTKPTDSEHLDEEELEDTELKENPEKQRYTGKKRGRPRKQPGIYRQLM